MPNHTPRIAVFGSINVDIVIRCSRLPARGETVIASSSNEVPGGKGGNQAVAAARLGAQVTMIGGVGDDVNANWLLKRLQDESIDVSHVSRYSESGSGMAVVTVEDRGENSILVVPGANGKLTVENVYASQEVLRASDTILLQLEVPIEVAIAVVGVARESGTRVVLDPAPAPGRFPPELLDVDLLCPNESEAALILSHPIDSVDAAREAAVELVRRGARNAIVTLGQQGAVVSDGNSARWVKPFSIESLDSTAAGDAFAATVAVCWTDETTLMEAAKLGCAAGAISATRNGAQPSLPTLAEVKQLAQTRGEK